MFIETFVETFIKTFRAPKRNSPARRAMLRAAILGGTALVLAGTGHAGQALPVQQSENEEAMSQHPYIGMWVTDDGHVRQELLENGRYDEARGTRQSAYQGRYEVSGNEIRYWDDTGFTADGTFVDADTLHHGGMVFRRR
ncbi:Atu4866 domain-containing protein [Phyllobacterium sp. 21LDTY02-6]|nr:Atu4866 domain-containing protein [Phyllobacterium sp. 21LDTY02-6]MCO4317589.1 Atu4866 domain-containing protein [Phyllobacterium sp. 21LDTY02-6]